MAIEVPLAWLWAEAAAEDLIVAGEEAARRDAFEFRATRDVLAMTLFLADLDRSSADLPANCLELLRDHLAVATGWLAWCRSRLEEPQAAMSTPDIRLAKDAWRWLRRGRLLAGPGLNDAVCGDDARPIAGPACRVSLGRARRVVDECLTGGI
ncbi:hypothetical protein ACQEVZ_40090 [Dactylosporangium sp. CA-152071]|uniref:hypothetical protein n=1 Tax=Dactylosporangium sp. CA-152071 TaxID=3239933 RepID=UPI003D8EA472